jgi:hypothetical protein
MPGEYVSFIVDDPSFEESQRNASREWSYDHREKRFVIILCYIA